MSNTDQSLCTCGCTDPDSNASSPYLYNLPGLTALKYRVGTHGSFKHAMLRALSTRMELNGLTTRKNEDPTVATIDAWATVLDVISFYQERIVNEGFLRTATERLSVVELASHISYRPGPGVSAATYLAFSMSEAPGAPSQAVIPAGTKVQSVPEQGQLPQVFETDEEIVARVEWNGIRIRTQKKVIPVLGDTQIYLQGINTGLQPGDCLLMIGSERDQDPENENWDFRRIKEVIPDNDLDHTKITWEKKLGKVGQAGTVLPAKNDFKVFALRQRAFLFGHNAPDVRILSKDVRDAFSIPATATEWPDFSISKISPATDTIMLDALYPKIIKDSWIVIMKDGYEEVYKVTDPVESSSKAFTLTAKTMYLKLSGENLTQQFDDHVRDAVVFAQSEEIEIAEQPVFDGIKNNNEITLEKIMPDLVAGITIAMSGQRKRLLLTEHAQNPKFTVANNDTATRNLSAGDSLIILKQPEQLSNGITRWTLLDDAGFAGAIEVKPPADENTPAWMEQPAEKDDAIVSELHTIKSILKGVEPTVLILGENVENYFDLPTVGINANTVRSTHGETKHETLGNGDGSLVFQKFILKQTPLSFVPAANASGRETTLKVWVTGILWRQVPTLYGIGPKEKVYITSMDDDGKVTVQFGDGITGARLPTGSQNVTATYRVGIGASGVLNQGQLSMMMTPQLGVNKVTNPFPSSGAQDPETLDTARQNAPLTVLTLDRIVSVKDFEDFARAFAGIGKARADMIWNGEKQVVHLTVAGALGGVVDPQGLLGAIKNSGHPHQTVQVDNYALKTFTVDAKIKVNADYIVGNVHDAVIQALTSAFSFEPRSFGQGVTPSEVIAVMQNVEGVVYVDLDKLDGADPFSTEFFFLPARVAGWLNGKIVPAELLLINVDKISITEMTS